MNWDKMANRLWQNICTTADRRKLKSSPIILAAAVAELTLNPLNADWSIYALKTVLKHPNTSFPLRVCMQPNVLRSRSTLQREADGLLSEMFSLTEHEYEKAFLFSKHISNVEQSQGILICEKICVARVYFGLCTHYGFIRLMIPKYYR